MRTASVVRRIPVVASSVRSPHTEKQCGETDLTESATAVDGVKSSEQASRLRCETLENELKGAPCGQLCSDHGLYSD